MMKCEGSTRGLRAVMVAVVMLLTVGLSLLAEMGRTVLPDYALTTLWLCLAVALGVAVVGMGTACAIHILEKV